MISWIVDSLRPDALHAGYLRAGRAAPYRLVAASEAPKDDRCPRWLALSPGGFVCDGHDGVTTDLHDATVAADASLAVRDHEPLPYGYATSYGTPLYTHVPTVDEEAKVEGDFASYAKQRARERDKLGDKAPPASALPIVPMPDFLADHAIPPPILGWPMPKGSLTMGSAWPNLRLSLLAAFESDGRGFYLTTEHYVVPVDRMRAARLADFHGIELARGDATGVHLPIAWVRWRPATLFAIEGDGASRAARATGEVLPFQFGGGIEPKEIVVGGVRYLLLTQRPAGVAAIAETARFAVRASDVTRVEPATKLPYDVGETDAWIEISISRQSLVLYRGLTPVFATLVSTGADGAGDVATTRSTPRGWFRIYSKHITYRMSAEEHPPWTEGGQPDPRYRIDDVPYVQYFQGGYALHAAYWHDSFGQPKSHGCVNLSPRDALWLFSKTTPDLPDGWYGVYAGRAGNDKGTVVVVNEW